MDGLCATACPVDINTGDLVKRLRRENHSAAANRIALWTARQFGLVVTLARTALKIGGMINRVFGKRSMYRLTLGLQRLLPAMPLWTEQIGQVPDISILSKSNSKNASIVYFPSCISRMLGTYEGKDKSILDTFLSICRKTGIEVKILSNPNSACCSQIYGSKGFGAAQRSMAQEIFDRLWVDSREGQLPVVIDVSSCAYTLHQLKPYLRSDQQERFEKLTVLDSVDFLYQYVLPRVSEVQKKGKIVLHPVCSLTKMKTTEQFRKIAERFAEEVTVPVSSGCCGMAGDRGFLIPELTESATAAEAVEVVQGNYVGYYSTTKTCEMAMSAAVNKQYESILYLVEEGL